MPGDLESVSEVLGIPVIRGSVDVKDLPAFFGHDCKAPDLSQFDVRIFAEIVEAPEIDVAAIVERAGQYRRDGADVIDLGCLPDTPFPHLEDAVQALKQEGYTVSVDSLEDEELLRGGKAGADYLLSLKESTAWIADETGSVPVLIPEQHTDMDSLYRVIEYFAGRDRPFIADAILDPIHFGFTESLFRYRQLRQQCPDIDIMMGIGNLTELTEADTTGINALLFGVVSELHITSVLATQVSPHARSAVREADKARRIMYAARKDDSLPKGIDGSLLTVHARNPFRYSVDEIQELANDVRDPNYRVQVSEQGIHVFNRDGMITGTDPYELFPGLKELEDDPPHAFYMGMELARAQIAWQLGKQYGQDEELNWGAALPGQDQAARDSAAKAAHNIGTAKQDSAFKEPKSTLKASREIKRKRRS
ncbi:MAG: dihydropteroate synthase [Thiotrichales bacterium]|nr:dihydropteroate synthase [Thiotrichales bacterium]